MKRFLRRSACAVILLAALLLCGCGALGPERGTVDVYPLEPVIETPAAPAQETAQEPPAEEAPDKSVPEVPPAADTAEEASASNPEPDAAQEFIPETSAESAPDRSAPEQTDASDTAPRTRGQDGDATVYVSNRSNTVHSRHDCSGMKNYREMTRREADAAGYKYCQKCW